MAKARFQWDPRKDQENQEKHGVAFAVAQLAFQRARTEEKKRQRAAALVEAARSLAVENGVASVTLTGVANRAGVHYSAVRRLPQRGAPASRS